MSLTKFKRIGQRFLTLLKDVSAEDLRPSLVLKQPTAFNLVSDRKNIFIMSIPDCNLASLVIR